MIFSCRWLSIAIWLLAWPLLPLGALGHPLPDEPVVHFDTGRLSALRDPSGQLDLGEVRAALERNEFRALAGNLTAGYVPDAYWLRLSFDRLPSQSRVGWLEDAALFRQHSALSNQPARPHCPKTRR